MRVIVCGGRDCTQVQEVRDFLSAQHKIAPITRLIHGNAHGVDSIAADWADYFDIPTSAYTADWARYGRGAGPRRNQWMLEDGRPELVIAILGGWWWQGRIRHFLC